MKELLLSRIQTPDGTILESQHVHDYVQHVDANGETYVLDGGSEYQRTTVNNEPWIDVSIYTDSPFEEIRKNIKRGTFNKKYERIWKPICELTDNHLKNIIKDNFEYRSDIDSYTLQFLKELIYRYEHNIHIADKKY